MNVSTIQMDPDVAKQKLEAYREGLRRRHNAKVDAEWSAAERAYRELAKGTPLIDLPVAIREAGWREDGRPKLAVTRADQRFCQWSYRDSRRWDSERQTFYGAYSPMEWTFTGVLDKGWDRQRSPGRIFEFAGITVEPPVAPKSGTAMVPLIPPDMLPSGGCDLKKHVLLWEVESWDAAAPIDPILLKPIGGDLYAVISEWDLTDLERSIISGTRR